MHDKIELLNKYLDMLCPYKNKQNKIINNAITNLIDICKAEIISYSNKCIQTHQRIQEYAQRLGLEGFNIDKENNQIAEVTNNDFKSVGTDDRSLNFEEVPPFKTRKTTINCIKEYYKINNIVLLYEYLNNKERRLYVSVQSLYYKAKGLIDNITKMKNYVHDSTPLEISIKNVNTTIYNKLIEIHLEYKNKVNEVEKQRNTLYKKILNLHKELEIVELDNDDKQIIRDYTSVDIHKLYDKYEALIAEKGKREEHVKKLVSDIQVLQTMLKEFYTTDFILETTSTTSNILDLQATYLSLQKTYQEHFDKIFADKHTELSELCKVFNIEMTEFTKTPEDLEIMSNIIIELNAKKASYVNIIESKIRRDALKNKMIEFERNASDPKRLFRSSFQLIKEEKFRKSAYPSLVNMEKKILEMIDDFEAKFGVFEYEGGSLKRKLVSEIENRIINRNVFIMNRNETPHKK